MKEETNKEKLPVKKTDKELEEEYKKKLEELKKRDPFIYRNF